MMTSLRHGRRMPSGKTVRAAQGVSAYVAQWHEFEVIDELGAVEATISATSYVVESSRRPVTFLWNGGPGASSSPLHMNALGPRIIRDGLLVDNPDSILDVSDLVFVDPVGTGFSRLVADGAEARLLNVDTDAAMVAALIRQWLTDHERLSSPIHLVGESYGGFRLAALAPLVADLEVKSVTLISPALDTASTATVAGNILPAVMDLPTMAVTAWRHGKARAFAGSGYGVREVWESADSFAVSELLPALYRGSALDSVERDRLIARIHELTGMPTELIAHSRLAVDSETFLRTLRADEDLLVGRLDTRVTGPVPPLRNDDKPGAVDDPALGIGSSFEIRSELISQYLHGDLNVPGDDEYISLSLRLNFAWDWRQRVPWPAEPYQSGVSSLRVLLDARPDTQVLLLGGFYDLATPLASTVRAARHLVDDDDRLTIVRLDAGHSIDEPVRARAAVALRQTIEAGDY